MKIDGGPFRVICADPPWAYKNVRTGGSMTSGSAAQYPVLAADEIARLGSDLIIANSDPRGSVLFLWATVPLMPDALAVMRSWGYTYKTALFWHKTGKLGTGFWFRGQVELCLLGVKGDVRPFRSAVRNLFEAKPTKHSRKPDEFFTLIDPVLDAAGLGPRLEVFARERREGWSAWGNEIA